MSPVSPAADAPRLPALDGIRGLAIVLVLCHNLQLLENPTSPAARAVEFLFDRGWVGVQLFFVLSGFLITGILLDTKSALNHYRSFFFRRALRIFPVYYLTLVFVLILLPFMGVHESIPASTLESRLPFWLYYSNWVAPHGPPQYALSHFWSLAIEEQFYWLWPLILFRLTARQTVAVCLFVAALSLAIRLAMLHAHADPDALYKFSVCRMDALALGGAAAAAMRLKGSASWISSRRSLWLAFSVVVGVAGLVVTRGYGRVEPVSQGVGYSILSLVFAVAVMLAADADLHRDHWLAKGLRWPALRMLGKYSYGMYVFHWPLNVLLGVRLAAMMGIGAGAGILASLAYVGLCGLASLALAMISYRFLESPLLSLKSRFRPVFATDGGVR